MTQPFRVGGLTMVNDVGPAEWVVAGVRDFRYDVGSLVPEGFPAYGRIFHPAGRRLGGTEDVSAVRWADVAAANGRTAHPVMEWASITGGWQFLNGESQPGVWDEPPSTGSLPVQRAVDLAEVLARFTATPERCWFGVWQGSGAPAWPQNTARTFLMPHRPMGLFTGPLSAVTTSFDRPPFDQRAHLWWPQDRAWCVATDVDLMTTYLGAEADCINAVTRDPRLESRPAGVDQRITWDSDTVNPPLPAPH